MIRILELLVAIVMIVGLANEAGPITAIFGLITFVYFMVTSTVLRTTVHLTMYNHSQLNKKDTSDEQIPTNFI